MKTLAFLIMLGSIAAAQDIAPEVTVAQLNTIIELQALRIRTLEAQVAELQRAPALATAAAGNIRQMQAACTAKDATLDLDPQSGLYKPDARGLPHCTPTPPPQGKAGK